MKKTFVTCILLIFTFSIQSQTIFGKWNSMNDKTGTIDSVVEIYQKKGKAYAKIIEIKKKENQNALCDLCEGSNKNKPILGLDILTGLEKDDNEWSGGKILDPRNGKIYKCYIQLEGNNKLKVRGYVGFALIGKTTYWQRAQ